MELVLMHQAISSAGMDLYLESGARVIHISGTSSMTETLVRWRSIGTWIYDLSVDVVIYLGGNWSGAWVRV